MVNILYVEDETDLAKIVCDCLKYKGFSVVHFTNGLEAFAHFSTHKPDMIILDVMVPDLDGFNLARKIRETDSTTPIIFVTARTQTADVVQGFGTGANDYVKKPYSIEELVVRMQALLKRIEKITLEKCNIGDYIFDPVHNLLTANNIDKKLSYRESELLRILFENKNQIVKRTDLLVELWDYESFFTGRSLDVFISRLRSYLKLDPLVEIMNIRGVGYMLIIH